MRLDVDVAIIVQQAPAKEEIENSDLLMWRSSEGPNPAAERRQAVATLPNGRKCSDCRGGL
ncbi:MAG: hypothetical protein DMG13_25515 [Acidobacteria bacterium]|nr:MAG: hypothetical protein DMG13_25515 [Acidobacteriota bacterium]